MNYIKKILLVFPVLVQLVSCTEVYYPETESGEKIIYIEGLITNNPGPYTVTLTYALPYNSKEDVTMVSGANVVLIENGVNREIFSETSEGIYKTNENGIQGKPGSSYQLIITAPDGNVYESDITVMPELPQEIDSVYGFAETKKIKYYNVYGDFILKEEPVVQLYADVATDNENFYSRFECRSILEYMSDIILEPGTSSAKDIHLFLWESFYSDDLSIIEINSAISQVKKIPFTYLSPETDKYNSIKDKHLDNIQTEYNKVPTGIFKDTIYTDSGIVVVDSVIYGIEVGLEPNSFYTGWILHITQFSISKQAYLFYTDIKKLEESEGEIFDPITTQIRGNMKCITDPDKLMIGLFEVASETVSPAFINFDATAGSYLSKMLNSVENISKSGWNDTIPPYFWVDKITDF